MDKGLNNNIFALEPVFAKNHLLFLQKYCEQNELTDYLLIASSGSRSHLPKVYFIKQDKMLQHAQMINELFAAADQVKWLIPLPLYYMGGASIYFRCLASGANYHVQEKWQAAVFLQLLQTHKITHTSLVPTQLFDVLNLNEKPPESLKYLFIGGDRLTPELKTQCLEKGWPVYETYGQTEFCSQIATSALPTEGLEVLPGFDLKIEQGLLQIKSDFHFDFILQGKRLEERINFADSLSKHGYFASQDRAKLCNQKLHVLGRDDELIKSKGKFVNLIGLETSLLAELEDISQKFFVSAQDDERQGKKLVFVVEQSALEVRDKEKLKKILKTTPIGCLAITNKIQKTASLKIKKKLSDYENLRFEEI